MILNSLVLSNNCTKVGVKKENYFEMGASAGRLNGNLIRGGIFVEKEIPQIHVNYAFMDHC